MYGKQVYRYWTREIIVLQKKNEIKILPASWVRGRAPRGRISSWRSFLPGSQPLNSGHSGEIVFTCAPAADSALTSGGQSEVRAMIQQFPYSNHQLSSWRSADIKQHQYNKLQKINFFQLHLLWSTEHMKASLQYY